MRVGIVTEGPSDFRALSAVLESVVPGAEMQHLWPETPAIGRPTGWRGVKSWCLENGSRLEVLLRGVPGREIDVLVVHVDCSMADKPGARRPCPPARDTADALRAVVFQDWIGRVAPCWLIVVTPAQTTDAWVVAALEPAYTPTITLECDQAVENELVRRKLLRRKGDEVKKPAAVYAGLVKQIVDRLSTVRSLCLEADRFCLESLAAADCVEAGCWGSSGDTASS